MNRLWVRLSLAFSGVILVGVASLALIAALVLHTGVRQYFLNSQLRAPDGLIDELARYYQSQDGWDGVDTPLRIARSIMPLGSRDIMVVSLADADRRIIHHSLAQKVGQRLSQAEWAESIPIQLSDAAPDADETVGYLHLRISPRSRSARGQRFFLEWLSHGLLLVAIVGGVVGILSGTWMSHSLTAPLSRLAAAARAIGARDLSHRVEVTGSDEIIEVAQAFNEMASKLEQAETLRCNLMADVAHELRTPLSVLQGNLRAILDDVYALDKAEVARLYDETRLLSRLVDDLHELAQAEAGQLQLNLQKTNLAELIQAAAATFNSATEAKSVTLSTQVPSDLPLVSADPSRLTQVLHNLMANALRHTPAGGKIVLSAGCDAADDGQIWLAVRDTGEGIAAQDLPHVFDRFYRADRARSRATGGAGLGLAIVRAIVEAHGGQVSAASDGLPGQGSIFTVRLPL
jgi:two-component system OmpR family sensor kinase/two-component system sensor histidine kinase BaeS